jgi:ribulose-5-phosphate 4-epimerase/fuculose-1-phosphate aldolase
MNEPLAVDAVLTPSLASDLSELAYACRIVHKAGHADMTLGYMALRDPYARGVWMKRAELGLGDVRSAADFVLLAFDGTPLFGEGFADHEWPIATEIMRARPDVNVVAHTHAFHATAFSALAIDLLPTSRDALSVGRPSRFDATTASVDTPELGAMLARALGRNRAVFLANHGIGFVGPSIAACTVAGIALEDACRMQLALVATGLSFTTIPDHEIAAEPMLESRIASSWQYLKRDVDTASHHWIGVPYVAL